MPRVAAHPDWPSVTEILKDTGLVRGSDFIPERYRERGRALHEVIAMYLDGLDVSDVAAELKPGLEGFLDFEVVSYYQSIASELELTHPFGFVGHIDLVGTTYGEDAVELIDIKYTESPDVKGATWQLAGYGLLWDQAHPERLHTKRSILQLSPKGAKPKAIDVTNPYATTVFTSALVVFNAKGKR
jgi:hypothetical protein